MEYGERPQVPPRSWAASMEHPGRACPCAHFLPTIYAVQPSQCGLTRRQRGRLGGNRHRRIGSGGLTYCLLWHRSRPPKAENGGKDKYRDQGDGCENRPYHPSPATKLEGFDDAVDGATKKSPIGETANEYEYSPPWRAYGKSIAMVGSDDDVINKE